MSRKENQSLPVQTFIDLHAAFFHRKPLLSDQTHAFLSHIAKQNTLWESESFKVAVISEERKQTYLHLVPSCNVFRK